MADQHLHPFQHLCGALDPKLVWRPALTLRVTMAGEAGIITFRGVSQVRLTHPVDAPPAQALTVSARRQRQLAVHCGALEIFVPDWAHLYQLVAGGDGMPEGCRPAHGAWVVRLLGLVAGTLPPAPVEVLRLPDAG